jgi:hypothetical protein
MKLSAVVFVCLAAAPAAADEGLWPFNQFPKDAVQQKYKIEVTDDFLNHLRLSSVQLAGGSGSFVSPNGLILTNQHIIAGCVPDVKNGFYAAAQADEARCTHMEAAVLVKMEDVTTQVRPASEKTDSLEQRNAAIARIEKNCAASTHNRCNVVRLFSGGRYDLYQYKTYSDVRLVFAPEHDLAFFGRERDAITYLRYGMDAAFLRVYEDGKPAATAHYLAWSAEPVQDGDLVFASGNPGPTMRLATAAQLTFYRDTSLPATLARLQPRIKELMAIPSAEPILNFYLNEFKVAAGKLIGLRDDRLVGRKANFEGKVRRTVERDPKLGTEAGKVWDQVATAYKSWKPYEKQYQIVTDIPKTSSPPNEAADIALVTLYLEELKQLGDKVAPVKAALGGKTPRVAAEAYVKGGKLADLAKLLEPAAQKIRKKHDDLIGSLETSATEKIAQYRFKLFGAAEYPDATSTPRVEFGVVKGYTDRAAVAMPFAATFGGLYYRKNDQGPYEVPQRWVDAKDALNQVTHLDFVSTCDIGGGDYGSATVNRAGKLVGVTFDGNLESLPDIYLYSDDQARAVHVSVQGIAEALEKVYKAGALLHELGWTGARANVSAVTTPSR